MRFPSSRPSLVPPPLHPKFPPILGALALLLCSPPSPILATDSDESTTQKSRQTSETFESDGPAISLNFLRYLPKDFDPDKEDQRWPLVIFLHGAGERGNDLEQVKKHGPPKRVEAGDDFPFILVSPQCPKEGWWPWEPVAELIDHLEATLPVDPDRIYLTGLSMGGYGTWDAASRHPDRFAAIAPICGGGTPYLMRGLKDLPVWAFHGAMDSVVPLFESERLVEALKKFGNTQTRFTVYPEATHDSWTAAYDDPALYEWLLSHHRHQAVPPPATTP